jgi:crossover junction endodeoxyribonuclease RusA
MIVLPWPPSANTYYRRVGAKTLISAKGRSYCKDVTALCQSAGVQKMEGRLQVVITACRAGVFQQPGPPRTPAH